MHLRPVIRNFYLSGLLLEKIVLAQLSGASGFFLDFVAIVLLFDVCDSTLICYNVNSLVYF